MKSTTFTLTGLFALGLFLGGQDLWAHGQGHKPDRREANSNNSSSIYGLLSEMDRQLDNLEEDLERENLRRVHGYSERLEQLANELAEKRFTGSQEKKSRIESSIRNFKSLVNRLHRTGDAGKFSLTLANSRKLNAQFSLLSRQLGYRFK